MNANSLKSIISILPSKAAFLDYLAAISNELCVTSTLAEFYIDNNDRKYFYYHKINPDKSIQTISYTKSDFINIIVLYLSTLTVQYNIKKGDKLLLYFTNNRSEDLFIRYCCALIGSIFVTVNWQADTISIIKYKLSASNAKVVFIDNDTPIEHINEIQNEFPYITIINPERDIGSKNEKCNDEQLIKRQKQEGVDNIESSLAVITDYILKNKNSLPTNDDIRCIIFTSGTTGNPKGVQLTYSNYLNNYHTFQSFIQLTDLQILFEPIIVNPMHHTNSTSITDWALRRPNSCIHLVERYSTQYWSTIVSIVNDNNYNNQNNIENNETKKKSRKILTPLVSRHIDFLESLFESNSLEISLHELTRCLSQIILLLGSAPVGPTTIQRLQKYANNIPIVRFGSTETTLQICGIPLSLSSSDIMTAFEKGWNHVWNNETCPGFYIGRHHTPFTTVKVVKSVAKNNPLYLQPCMEGEPGYIITKGGHVMKGGYVQIIEDEVITCDGWQSRDSQLLIRGGANYSYEQINNELSQFLLTNYHIPLSSFRVAVCGLKIKSEHEDDCCVMIEFFDDNYTNFYEIINNIQLTFIDKAKKMVSKGSKPDQLMLVENSEVIHIPMVQSKGIISIPELLKLWKKEVSNLNLNKK
eukprot:gene10712-14384_t